jgi:hypothetical protein
MPPVTRILVTKKKDEGPCGQCPKVIPEGAIHATAVRTFGLSQEGKRKYKTDHLHMTCIATNLMVDYLRFGERRAKEKKVRGPSIPPEHREKRAKLIRTRARLLRLVLAAATPERIEHLRDRVVLVQRELVQCGGMPRESMMRRSEEDQRTLASKLAPTTGS